MHFPYQDDYLHEREEYARPHSRSRANVTLAVFHNDERTKAVIIECKRRPGNQNGYPSNTAWSEAKSQLQTFMLASRRSQESLQFGIFGCVAIGKWARFFVLANNRDYLQSFQGNSALFHIEDHAQAIEGILTSMKTEIDNAKI